MFMVVTGGSGSGKSAYAEEQVARMGDKKRYYIATMMPFGEEGEKRIKRHRLMRKEKNFETIECYTDLKNVILPKDCTVLLECMSNLAANELYAPKGNKERAPEVIMEGIRNLKAQVGNLIVVTNEVFTDGISYNEEMEYYLKCLGRINREMAEEADVVTEVVCGIPIPIKERLAYEID